MAISLDVSSRLLWLMENFFVMAAIAAFAVTFKKYPLSDISYTLIALFILLHEVGARYSYEAVPIGFRLQEMFHLTRNDYDRVVHFAFGACFSFPLWELETRLAKVPAWLHYVRAIVIILAFSAFYEIAEAYSFAFVSARVGNSYLSLQGDVFDSQMDMAASAYGAMLTMSVTAMFRRRRR